MDDVRREKLEAKVINTARRFHLDALLNVLQMLGYSRPSIRFESSPGPDPKRSLVESVRFELTGPVIELNLGLTGGHGLLPSYFDVIAESLPDSSRLHRFLQFFDNQLLKDFATALTPEHQDQWPLIQEAHFFMLGHGSVATLTWLFSLFYPELGIHVHRADSNTLTNAYAVRTGVSRLDGSAVLGPTYDLSKTGFHVELTSDEDKNDTGQNWWDVASKRLQMSILPILENRQFTLWVTLVLLNHKSDVHLTPDVQLGAQRMGGEQSEHRISLYQG